MRHKGNFSEAKVIRNKKLVKMYRATKALCIYDTIGAICAAIAEMEVDQYYMSEERGREIYMRWRRRKTLPNGSPWRKKLYRAFVKECACLESEGMKPKDAVWEALQKPAPNIGLSPCRIQDIMNEEGQK